MDAVSNQEGDVGMAERKDYDSISIVERDGASVLDLGSMEIWDGADLSLLRDSLNQLSRSGCGAIGVDMTYVKYVPSGFFGMLYEVFERGVDIRLYNPQPRVRNMLWFRKFFDFGPEGSHQLRGAESTRKAVSRSRVRI